MSTTQTLPPCGLYKTGMALTSDPASVPAGRLVMFHNHSDKDMPFVQLPRENVNNTWDFNPIGPGIGDDEAFIGSLQPLKPQGVYVLSQDIATGSASLPAGTLVQLGYNRDGDPILFTGYWHEGRIAFPSKGYRFEDPGILDNLQTAFLASQPKEEEPPEKGIVH